MDKEHTIHGLMRKRAELAGQLLHHQKVVRQLLDALDGVDRTLKLFNPNVELFAIRSKKMPGRHLARHREMSQIIFSALRERAPQTIRELTDRVMEERFLDRDDKKLLSLMRKRVMAACRQHRRRGIMFSVQGTPYMLWDMVK